MKLNVLICTFNQGIHEVSNIFLPFREDVTYIVSHQYDDKSYNITPSGLVRNDVKIIKLYGRGLSINRNFAMSHAGGDIAIIADDDIRYSNKYFDKIKEYYTSFPDLDVGLFKIKTGIDDPPYKAYPDKPFVWSNAKQHSVSSIEITFRLSRVKNRIWFDERFGLGSRFLIGGEENVFLHECMKSGLNIKYFPEFIVEHPYESFNKNISKYDRRRIRTQAALDLKLMGLKSVIRSFLMAIRRAPAMIREGESPLRFLFNRLIGAWIIIAYKERETTSK